MVSRVNLKKKIGIDKIIISDSDEYGNLFQGN